MLSLNRVASGGREEVTACIVSLVNEEEGI